jgi:hypothetical protein
MNRFRGLRLNGDRSGSWSGFEGEEYHTGFGPTRVPVRMADGEDVVLDLPGSGFYSSFSAGFPLFLIREAWDLGLDLEAEADGYGAGAGTHGDWSGIRDSSDAATERMLEKALNFLFPARPRF